MALLSGATFTTLTSTKKGPLSNLLSQLNLSVEPELEAMFEWVHKGCPLNVPDVSEQRHAYIAEALVFLFTLIYNSPQGTYFHSLLFSPNSVARQYAPSAPVNSTAAVFKATAGLGWYRCPNGHLYAVDGCTLPVRVLVCI